MSDISSSNSNNTKTSTSYNSDAYRVGKNKKRKEKIIMSVDGWIGYCPSPTHTTHKLAGIEASVGLLSNALHSSGVSPLCIPFPPESSGWNKATSTGSPFVENPPPVANMPCGHSTVKEAPEFGWMSLIGLLIATTFSCIASVIAPLTKFLMSSSDGVCPFPMLSKDVVLLGVVVVVVVVVAYVGTGTGTC